MTTHSLSWIQHLEVRIAQGTLYSINYCTFMYTVYIDWLFSPSTETSFYYYQYCVNYFPDSPLCSKPVHHVLLKWHSHSNKFKTELITFPLFEIPYKCSYLLNKNNWYHTYHAQCTHHFCPVALNAPFSHGCDQQGES